MHDIAWGAAETEHDVQSFLPSIAVNCTLEVYDVWVQPFLYTI